jgi:hypothetical protein
VGTAVDTMFSGRSSIVGGLLQVVPSGLEGKLRERSQGKNQWLLTLGHSAVSIGVSHWGVQKHVVRSVYGTPLGSYITYRGWPWVWNSVR